MADARELTPEAQTMLNVLVEAFRETVAPSWDAEEFRLSMIELLERNLVKIVKRGDVYELHVPPELQGDFGGIQ